jgi:hypothetical protein
MKRGSGGRFSERQPGRVRQG